MSDNNKKFIISSENSVGSVSLETNSKGLKSFYYNPGVFVKYGEIRIFIEGYVLPRDQYNSEFEGTRDHYFIYKCFTMYGSDFVKKIKGFFLIVIIEGDKFLLFNDIHSAFRFYYQIEGDKFIITNDISLIRKYLSEGLDDKFPAHQALFQHLIFSKTLFKGVLYSEFATKAEYLNGKIKFERYWDTDDLLNLYDDFPDKEFIEYFNSVVNNTIRHFNTDNIAATLTGGRDTRTVLASLVSNGYKPRIFTFGNRLNRDVIVSKEISEILNLEFINPDISDPDPEIYLQFIERIAAMKEISIHIHRAHRLHAIEMINEENPADLVFVGAMGGDYIKGTSFDNYIVTEFIRRFFFERETSIKDIIVNILDYHYIRHNDDFVNKIAGEITASEVFSSRMFDSKKDMLITHDIVGCTHDIQDIRVFMNSGCKVIAPYMDPDIMSALFRTRFSLLKNSKNDRNPVKRYLGGELQGKLVMKLLPEIGSVNYANYYSPSDVTKGAIIYLVNRTIAYIKQKMNKSVSGFEYGDWFNSLVIKQIEKIKTGELSEYYDFDKMATDLKAGNFRTDEGYWHRFSNPLMFNKYIINAQR